MLTVMVVLMDTDTPMLMLDTITAKDLLNPLLSPPLLLNLDTVTVMLTATDTDTDMVTVMLTDPDTPMLDTITAKDLLKPSHITVTVMLLLMPTMVTVMVMVTVMATVTVMASKSSCCLSYLITTKAVSTRSFMIGEF